MIIISYIIRKALKRQVSILLVLFLSFFFQNFFRMLDLIKNKNINKKFLLLLFGLNIPKILQFIFPFSIFLSLLITFIRMQENNELLAIYICGINRNIVIISILILSFFLSSLTIINSFWISPWLRNIQENFIHEKRKNFYGKFFSVNKIQWIKQKNLMFFFEKKENRKVINILLIKFYPSLKDWSRLFIIVANYGNISFNIDNLQEIILEKGKQYEVVNNRYVFNFYVSNFQFCRVILKEREEKNQAVLSVERMNFQDLLASNHLDSKIELHWRFTLVFSVFISNIIVFSLFSKISRKKNMRKIFLSVFLFFLFFLLQIYFHTNNRDIMNFNSIFWIELINFSYFFYFLLKNFLNKKSSV